jgi:excisionase family DNA binding protein
VWCGVNKERFNTMTSRISSLRPLISVADACEHLRVSPRTIYRLIQNGQIEAVQIGRQWRIFTDVEPFDFHKTRRARIRSKK